MKLKAATLLILSICLFSIAFAQKKKEQPQSESRGNIADKVSAFEHLPGFIHAYYDEKQDKIYLRIDLFDSTFLYVNSLASGVGSNDIGLDRGQLGKERVVKFERRGPKVLLVEPNLMYRATSTNQAEIQAVEEAFAHSVIFGFKVEAEEAGSVLVDATDFFMQDAHDVSGTLKSTQQGSYSIEKSRSAFHLPRTKNFPDNSEFEVTLTFIGQATGNYIKSVAPNPNSITVRQHHSFVRLPDNNFVPRKFDPRAGYFSMSYYDYGTPINEKIEKRFITRHRLEKKDPSAQVSEPVEPIVYYLDRGTPEPIRSALLDGARWWNQAFEAAGYKDAFRVEMMPEGADPMDVRYNVIQWVHRSTRGWSYGASVTDPRTGEIIKGHVTLGSLRVRQDYLIAEGLLAPYKPGSTNNQMQEMALARLRQLSAHEVGHTLGLAHSYASSTEDLASVMDYPHPVVTLKNGAIDLSNAYDTKIGAWDKVAITYGYQDFPAGTNEEQELNNIIQGALKSGLTFLSDQDARPQGGSHPYAHLWDNGRDAADELNRVMEIRQVALKNFGENNIRPGMPYASLEEVLVPIYFFHRYQTEAAAKAIGGLNYRYALRGDNQLITEFVSPTVQGKALQVLLKTLSPEFLALPEPLLKIIPPRPIGYTRHREVIRVRTDLTFDALGAAESVADMTASLLLNPARAGRLVEYSGRDQSQPSLQYVLDQLINSTIKSPSKPGYLGSIQITVNDVVLNNLINLANASDASLHVRNIAAFKIEQVSQYINESLKTTADESWRAHRSGMLDRIKQFQKNPQEFKPFAPLAPPPGQPIGTPGSEYGCEY